MHMETVIKWIIAAAVLFVIAVVIVSMMNIFAGTGSSIPWTVFR
jgi:hypothetical protein